MQTPTATKVSTLTLKEQQTSGLHLLKKSCKKKKIKGSSDAAVPLYTILII